MEIDIRQLTSNEGVQLCESLLKSHFISKGYSETDVAMILDNIEITLRRRCLLFPSIHTTQPIMYVMPILFTCWFVGQSYIFENRSHLSAIGLLAH